METIVSAKNLLKTYSGLTAVNRIEFSVQKGECFGILGPNGAGKTSLMRMLYNLSSRDEGELLIFGKDPRKEEISVKHRMGIVPQEDNLDPDLSVRENLETYGWYFGLPSKNSRERIESLMDFLDLRERSENSIQELSGGMKRRLILCRALLNKPDLLLLDEPTTGLDPAARHLIWEKLRSLQKEKISIILTTHYMEEAACLCDRIMIMDKGNIILEGNPQKLLENHFERYVLETEHTRNDLGIKNIRSENSGNRIFFFSNNEQELFQIRTLFENQQVIIRNATLEDLFLKLTGRDLNE